MPDDPPAPITPETVRKMAEELVGLKLPPDQVGPLADTIRGLLPEIAPCLKPEARGRTEPDVLPTLEDWPR
ncbi:MAG: hypothetical protein U0790_00620 [Isosphaeraceae bacterium]